MENHVLNRARTTHLAEKHHPGRHVDDWKEDFLNLLDCVGCERLDLLLVACEELWQAIMACLEVFLKKVEMVESLTCRRRVGVQVLHRGFVHGVIDLDREDQ